MLGFCCSLNLVEIRRVLSLSHKIINNATQPNQNEAVVSVCAFVCLYLTKIINKIKKKKKKKHQFFPYSKQNSYKNNLRTELSDDEYFVRNLGKYFLKFYFVWIQIKILFFLGFITKYHQNNTKFNTTSSKLMFFFYYYFFFLIFLH